MVSSTFILGALVSVQLASAAAISSAASTCRPSTVTQVTTVTKASTVTVSKPASTVTVTVTKASVASSSGTAKSTASSANVTSTTRAESTSGAATGVLVKDPSSVAKSSSSAIKSPTSLAKPSTSSSGKASSASSAPVASATTTRTKFIPSLNTTFIYDLDNQPIAAPIINTSSGLSLNKEMYIVDMAQSTPEQIANYHAQGKKVGCYFSAGTWEPYRSDRFSFLPECYCGPNVKTDSDGKCVGSGADNNLLGEWGEWWLDLNHTKCLDNIKPIMSARIKEAAKKGCDAIDPDNVDSFMNKQNYGATAQDEVNYLLWLASEAKANGLAIDLKNSGTLLTDPDTGKKTPWTDALVNAFDFNVIESCHQYNECNTYDPFLKAGKPQIQIEYESEIKKCPTLQKGQNLLVYSGLTVDSTKITLSC